MPVSGARHFLDPSLLGVTGDDVAPDLYTEIRLNINHHKGRDAT